MPSRWTASSAVAAAAIGAFISREVRRFAVVEESMAPALLPGDFLVTRRLDGPRRGDVVVFAHPDRPAFFLIKRVVGCPGEAIDIAGGQVHINGQTLTEPWAQGPTMGDGSWTLGDDEAFLLGDARALSADDSRTIGPVAVGGVAWKAVLRYWPLSRAGRPAEF